jgi:hypothetical protein
MIIITDLTGGNERPSSFKEINPRRNRTMVVLPTFVFNGL